MQNSSRTDWDIRSINAKEIKKVVFGNSGKEEGDEKIFVDKQSLISILGISSALTTP